MRRVPAILAALALAAVAAATAGATTSRLPSPGSKFVGKTDVNAFTARVSVRGSRARPRFNLSTKAEFTCDPREDPWVLPVMLTDVLVRGDGSFRVTQKRDDGSRLILEGKFRSARRVQASISGKARNPVADDLCIAAAPTTLTASLQR